MKLALISDAWQPQVNGVVTTLVELILELEKLGYRVEIIHPGLFNACTCTGYAGVDLAIRPKKQLLQILTKLKPEAVHIATEGPLGWAARSICLNLSWPFTSAFHTKFPEIFNAWAKVPVSWGYALLKHFHRPSSGVLIPTQSVLMGLQKRGFQNLKAWSHGVDIDLFRYHDRPVSFSALGVLPRPIALFVGRISPEKNIEAFLEMDFPGSKIVCGIGPLEKKLKQRYPKAYWLGILPRNELAVLYASADVFVFPSVSDTFGLVLLEAMATGTPVACYPADGPLEVIGASDAGVMSHDLSKAATKALQISRQKVRARAEVFSWHSVAKSFANYLTLIPQNRA